MIGKRERGVSDLRGEGLDQVGGDGAVDHADDENLQEDESGECRQVGRGASFAGTCAPVASTVSGKSLMAPVTLSLVERTALSNEFP